MTPRTIPWTHVECVEDICLEMLDKRTHADDIAGFIRDAHAEYHWTTADVARIRPVHVRAWNVEVAS